MKSQLVLHTVWCNVSGEAAGEIWNWSLLGVKGQLRWCYTGQLATPLTCNADSQLMFLARICRLMLQLHRFQKLGTRCSTANIAKNRSQRAVTLEWFFAQHRIIAHELALQADQCNTTFKATERSPFAFIIRLSLRERTDQTTQTLSRRKFYEFCDNKVASDIQLPGSLSWTESQNVFGITSKHK